MGFEDPLRLVLREAALELAAAVYALEVQAAKLGEVRPVNADAAHVLRGLQERRQQADGIQDLQGARLDRRGARLVVQPHILLDEADVHAVAGEL